MKIFSLKTVLICFLALAVFFAGYVVGGVHSRLRYHVKREYDTADVIRAADRFVSEHPGQWPHSWDDLGMGDRSSTTDFRFDLTPQAILSNKELIFSAIQPKYSYWIYPHARDQLEALYKLMRDQEAQSRSIPPSIKEKNLR